MRQRDLPGVFDRNRKRRASVFRMGYRQSVKRKSGDYDRIEVQVAHDVMGGVNVHIPSVVPSTMRPSEVRIPELDINCSV